MTVKKILPLVTLVFFLLASCAPGLLQAPPTSMPASPSPSDTPSPEPTMTWTPTATFTPTATDTPTPTITPTFAILRGEINADHVACKYGPGAPYLYKYGLLGGSNLNIIGRIQNSDALWIEVQAIGGNNPCWMNAKYMTIKGDVSSVQPIDPLSVILPLSPYYGPLTGVTAIRKGNVVNLSWNELVLRAGDDSLQFPYLVEAWVCVNGQIVFTPIGSYPTIVNVNDEPGCSEPSFGRVYGVEKHGYTKWVKFAWPQANATPQPSASPTQ